MKKIIFSLIAIVAVAGMAGFGTYAVWVDDETSSNNVITADKMDLVLTGTPMTIGNVEPGETGVTNAMTAQNDSNEVDATLSFAVTNLVDNENTCEEPETTVTEGNDTDCGATDGELSGFVTVGIEADLDGDATYETTVAEILLSTLNGSGYQDIGTILPGNTANIRLTYTVADNAAYTDNVFMTDDSTFDVNFKLTQN